MTCLSWQGPDRWHVLVPCTSEMPGFWFCEFLILFPSYPVSLLDYYCVSPQVSDFMSLCPKGKICLKIALWFTLALVPVIWLHHALPSQSVKWVGHNPPTCFGGTWKRHLSPVMLMLLKDVKPISESLTPQSRKWSNQSSQMAQDTQIG